MGTASRTSQSRLSILGRRFPRSKRHSELLLRRSASVTPGTRGCRQPGGGRCRRLHAVYDSRDHPTEARISGVSRSELLLCPLFLSSRSLEHPQLGQICHRRCSTLPQHGLQGGSEHGQTKRNLSHELLRNHKSILMDLFLTATTTDTTRVTQCMRCGHLEILRNPWHGSKQQRQQLDRGKLRRKSPSVRRNWRPSHTKFCHSTSWETSFAHCPWCQTDVSRETQRRFATMLVAKKKTSAQAHFHMSYEQQT